MSDHSFDNFDMCPVCAQMYVDPPNYYCSEVCREKARVFRRRFDRLVRAFRKLEFECTWKEGIHLEMKVPEYIAYAYPDTCLLISFGGYEDLINMSGVNKFWKRVEAVLGHPMSIVLQSAYTYSGNSDLFGKDYISSRVQAFLYFDDYTFKCEQCLDTYVKSYAGYEEDMKLCTRCAIEKIPF